MLEGEDATRDRIERWWHKIAVKCLDHKTKVQKSASFSRKYVVWVYYTGHGHIKNATQRICLYDDDAYQLEQRLRSFKNKNASNCFAIGIFDTCRVADGAPEDEIVKKNQGGQHHSDDSDDDDLERFETKYQNRMGKIDDNEGNLVIMFSSEPTKATYVKDRFTYKLINHMK